MKNFATLFLLVFLTGCSAIQVNVPNIDKSNVTNIIDLRPATEKERKVFSTNVFSEAYATYRLKETVITPTPIRIFQHRVYEKFTAQNLNPEVKVHHLVVYMNMKSELRQSAAFGLIGTAIASTRKLGVNEISSVITQAEFDAIGKEYKRALFTENENPSKASVYVTYIDAEINGKRAFIKTITPTRLPKENGTIPIVFAVEKATAFFLSQLNSI